MRKLYNEFFYISKHGKIGEKVMLTRVITTVAVVMICLIAMSLTAYAYFVAGITSGANVIKGATFETTVSIQAVGKQHTDVAVITSNHQTHCADLKANQLYTVTLQHTNRSTAQTGFVILTAKNCQSRYHTQQLGRDANGNTETITFSVTPTADTTVTFQSHWGTSSHYPDFIEKGENDTLYIVSGETVLLSIQSDNADNGQPNAPTDQTQQTTQTGETTTTTAPTTTVPAVTETTTTSPSTTNTTDSTTTTTTEQTPPAESSAGTTTTEADSE